MNSFNWANEIAFGTAIIAMAALIIQSRGLKRHMKLQNFMEYTKRYQEIILHFPESINEDAFKIENPGKGYDYENLMRYMRVYFDLCSEELHMHEKGYIDKEIWENWREGMEYAFSKSAFKQAWKIISKDTKYYGDFGKFVNDLNQQ